MIDKGATDWNQGLQGAMEGRRMTIALVLIQQGADYWNSECVAWLAQRPDQVLRLFQTGRVARALFAAHDVRFEQWIAEVESQYKQQDDSSSSSSSSSTSTTSQQYRVDSLTDE